MSLIFNPETFALDVSKNGVISSEDLNAFTQGIAKDMASISSLFNDTLAEMLDALPSEAITNGLDGAAIYVDKDSTAIKDNALFWHPTETRPLTVYESFLVFIQILANTENGLREGLKIGTISAPITITSTNSNEYDWPYFDGAFEYQFYIKTGDVITKMADGVLDISVDYATKKITLDNQSGSDKTFYGFIWHPVYTF